MAPHRRLPRAGQPQYQQHEGQSETMLPGDAELTGRVGTGYKRRRIGLDGPLHCVVANGAAMQRFELSGGRAVHNTGGDPNYSAGDITDRPSPAITVGSISRDGGRASNHFPSVDATMWGKFTIASSRRI